MLEAAIILACAVAYRLRGSAALSDAGTFIGRLLWSAVAASALTASLAIWWLVATIPFWFLGAIVGRQGAIDLGRMNESPWRMWSSQWWEDALLLLIVGLLTVLGGVFGALFADGRWWFLLAAGLSMPLCYEAGWRIPSTIRHIKQGPELAEVIYGAIIGVGIAAL